jgi:hypothetical protein
VRTRRCLSALGDCVDDPDQHTIAAFVKRGKVLLGDPAGADHEHADAGHGT